MTARQHRDPPGPHSHADDHPHRHPHDHPHRHGSDHHHGHPHSLLGRLFHFGAPHGGHGEVDASLARNADGIRAVKLSFAVLIVTAVLQVGVVWLSNSVALLADTIHNFADAGTSIPLWIAFLLARRPPTRRFTYGLGRAEDLAGIIIVLVIFSSALVAGWQAIERFVTPAPVAWLGVLAAAGIIGFAGNEIAAAIRIRTGRSIGSAALVADGQHSRIDGLTSLAVVLGAAGVWLGFPLADPIVGLVITVMIFGIVWQSARAVFIRVLDGVEGAVVEEIARCAGQVSGSPVYDVRARWVGHQLHAELTVSLPRAATTAEATAIVRRIREELGQRVPGLTRVVVEVAATA